MKYQGDIHHKDNQDLNNIDDSELLENLTISESLDQFLDAELQTLNHQIKFTENIISNIDDELSRSDDAQSFRIDKYRAIEEIAPINVVELLEKFIKSGMSYRSLLQKTNENFNHIYDALKSAYASYLELSIKVKNL